MVLKNKVAIVTGAASGIGRELAMELARHGCTLVLVDIAEDGLAKALDEVRAYTPASTAETCDISNHEQVRQMVKAIHERHGSIDILVNNAAIMSVKLFKDLSKGEFKRHMDVNYYGPVALIRDVVPIMEKQGKGVIINVASVGARLVVPGTSAYAASKAAIQAFSEALYYELKDRGIHVGIVVPGGIKTGIFNAVDTKLGVYYRDQCTTPPSKITRSIRQAIEKERFETVVPFSSRILLGVHAHLPSIFRKSLLSRLRPYFE
ncbi:MAG: SDR family oxidoreductase [Dehalococcoidia bacterium]|nr:MAG: SDR family oxidoreductase [Dehalococcoidia bacterium]